MKLRRTKNCAIFWATLYIHTHRQTDTTKIIYHVGGQKFKPALCINLYVANSST